MQRDQRQEAGLAFLAGTEWRAATLVPMGADASNRRYFALNGGPTSALLMDSPPEKGEDLRPFLQIADHLRGAGISAPSVYASDVEQGFAIIENLGDCLLAQAVDQAPETELYVLAAEVLSKLADQSLPEVGRYDSTTMPALADLATQWYAPGAPSLAPAMEVALREFDDDPRVLVLRDYHAENLIWRPAEVGLAKMGVIDFQDAQIGHGAYDLVSLVFDARRDVGQDAVDAAVRGYQLATGADPERFEAALATMSAQRNLRILGVFARLCLRDGKPGYLKWVPRVWRHLQRDLKHPHLAELRAFADALPHPTKDYLDGIAAKCPV